MRVSRRLVLLGAAAGAAGTGIGAIALRHGAMADFAIDVVRRSYGRQFSSQPAALEFAEAYEAFMEEKGAAGLAVRALYGLELDRFDFVAHQLLPQWRSIVQKFSTSTNVILAYETGAPLEFMGLHVPYLSPCSNQLSALAIS